VTDSAEYIMQKYPSAELYCW